MQVMIEDEVHQMDEFVDAKIQKVGQKEGVKFFHVLFWCIRSEGGRCKDCRGQVCTFDAVDQRTQGSGKANL
eukprot:1162148-Pelagomonas_calceolata.AAC.4